MEKEQAREWAEAQALSISVDLVEAAKKHLKFFAELDRNRALFEDHVLQRAIYRYNACWIPLLAKHLEKPVTNEEALVVPLDCEWIWHCHRLNPLRYKSDCEKSYGRILDNHNVISSFQATSKNTTEEIWSKMYPDEPFELDMSKPILGDGFEKSSANEKFTDYDLLSGAKRQMSFKFQITRPYTGDDLFLQEAAARYKGFLHMIRATEKKNIMCFFVPTYDIDIMWHTHLLHPVSYCKDLIATVGRVLHHNDTVTDRSPGKPLIVGFTDVTRLWRENYGRNYWKAGTLYEGNPPTPITQVPVKYNVEGKELSVIDNCHNPIQFPSIKAVEVLLEFVEIKNLPEGHKGNLVVSFSKKQPDKLFNVRKSLNISSETGEKQVTTFQCEPTGEFLFELMSSSPASDDLSPKKPLKLLGTCSISVEEFTGFGSRLSADMWVSLEPAFGDKSSEPILLQVSISFTPPTPAAHVFKLARSQSSENAETHVHVLDQCGERDFSLHMRSTVSDATKSTPDLLKEVYCITDSGEKHRLAELVGNYWHIKGSNGSFKLQNNSGNDDSLFELAGYKMVKIFPGRRLDFEDRFIETEKPEQGFLTAVEFSAEFPSGKAIALIDFKSQTIKAIEEWIILPGITLAFILSEILRGDIDWGEGNVIQGIAKMADIGVLDSGMLDRAGASPCSITTDCGEGYCTERNLVKAGVEPDPCGICVCDCGVDGRCNIERNLVKTGVEPDPCTHCFCDCGVDGCIERNLVKAGIGEPCSKAGGDKNTNNDNARPLAAC